MVLAVDTIYDGEWTQRAFMGRESELGRLANVLQTRASNRGRPDE